MLAVEKERERRGGAPIPPTEVIPPLSYKQWVYNICNETFHLGNEEMMLLYDVMGVSLLLKA